MGELRARVEEIPPSRAPNEAQASGAAEVEQPGTDDDELVARTSLARRRGERDEDGVKSLLSRAAIRHRAALDRLAR